MAVPDRLGSPAHKPVQRNPRLFAAPPAFGKHPFTLRLDEVEYAPEPACIPIVRIRLATGRRVVAEVGGGVPLRRWG